MNSSGGSHFSTNISLFTGCSNSISFECKLILLSCNGLFAPYFISPRIGVPSSENCTLIW